MKISLPYGQFSAALAETYLSSGQRELPSHLMCPITYDLMDSPVVNAAGSSYSKGAITEYILRNWPPNGDFYSDPLTRTPVRMYALGQDDNSPWANLHPNQLIDTQVREFRDAVQAGLSARNQVIARRVKAYVAGRRVRDDLLTRALQTNDKRAVAFYMSSQRPGLAYNLRRSQACLPLLRETAAACIQAAWRGGQARVAALADSLASGGEAADLLEKRTSKKLARKLLQSRQQTGSEVRLNLYLVRPSRT